MKRKTTEIISWHRRRAQNERRRERNRIQRRNRISGRAEETARIDRVPRPIQTSAAPRYVHQRGERRRCYELIQPPADFSLRTNYEAVVSFFSHLRSRAYNDRVFETRPYGVDFASLKNIAPGAGLMLAAELYRIQKFVGKPLSAIHQEKWDPTVRRLLHELGLFDLLKTPNVYRQHNLVSDDITIIKYEVDAEVTGEKCGELLDCLTEIAGDIPAQNFIYDGLIEALKNAKHHAYSEPETWFGVAPGTWFMTGSYNKREKQLTAAVFDLGVGIPVTLPRSGILEHIRQFLSFGHTSDDGKMIAAAMEYGRSRTYLKERGRGLPVMMRLLDHHQGYLRIVSGRGEAKYDSLTKTIDEKTHTESIGGTLIEWSITSDRRNENNG